MTQIIVVEPGQSNVVASGPQFGVKYVLTGMQGDGSRVVFNDPQDRDYVGWLTNITGLDSPEVRESADDLIGDDGGVHGDFFYGRRPIVLEGQIDNRPATHHYDIVDGIQIPWTENRVRNARMTALQRVTNAMRKDLQMRWAPEGGIEQTLYLRRNQPLRIAGAFNKTFQAALVSADPRIYAAQVKDHRFAPNDHDDVIENDGTMRTPPVATVYGPATAIEVHNHTTGQYFVFAPSYALTAGQSLVIDFKNRTVEREDGTNVYQYVQFASSTWWQVEPGRNIVAWHATGIDPNSSMVLRWQDAWV